MFILIFTFLNKGECLTAYQFVFSEWGCCQPNRTCEQWCCGRCCQVLRWSSMFLKKQSCRLERLSVFLERLFAQQKCINVSWPVSASERSLQEPVWLQMYRLKRLAITEFLTDALAWFPTSVSSCRAEAAHTGTQSDFYTQFNSWIWIELENWMQDCNFKFKWTGI